jgi:subtilisin family serine protease
MRSKKTIGIMLAVIIAISAFTAVIPGIASESAHTLETLDISSASKGARILPIENVKSSLTDAQKKLSTDLLQLLDCRFLPQGQNMENHKMQMKKSGQLRPAGSVSPKLDRRVVVNDLVYVYIYLKPPAGTQAIEPYVREVTDRDEKNHIAVAWIEVKKLEKLASLKTVRTIRTVMPPLVMTGSVTTKGDAIHRTSDVRTTYSQSGSGVKVGIISDGVAHWTDARDSGDLPAGLTVLSDTQGGDEGTALLEIVHDMVPDADLYFHDHGNNWLAFNAAIDALVAAGCDVICDDVGWITEPFFEDGTIAKHLTSVLDNNDIIYVSSAGNAAYRHYQGDYYNIPGCTQHDFSSGGTTGYYLYLNMSAGDSVRIVLQWNDQFGSSWNDYDLYLHNIGTGTTVAWSEEVGVDPLEYISYTVPDGTLTADYAIIVNKWRGVGKTLEVFIYPRNGAWVYDDNIVPADSIFGHKAVPDAIAVGAIAADDPGNDDIEFFSSQGPVTISYPKPVSRAKPDLCGIDRVTVTGAGSFPRTFWGTSAAAPHIAAIAAQLWGAYPSETGDKGDKIRTMMYDSAVDLGDPEYDNVFGYGRADALDALGDEFEPIPEFTTIAIPVVAILGLMFLFSRRKRKE